MKFIILTILLGLILFGFTGLSLSAQTPTDIRPLSLGQSIERELKGEEVHSYSIAVISGQYLHVVVDQRGIDVVVALFGVDGKKVIEVDSPNEDRGPEPLLVIVEATGNYRLEIQSLKKTAASGKYEVKIEEQRKATERDENYLAAEFAFAKAEAKNAEGNEESLKEAIVEYEKALGFYRVLGDLRKEAITLNNIGLIYDHTGSKKKALEYYEIALNLFRKVKDIESEATALNNIGLIYYSFDETQKALDYFTRAMKIYSEIGNQANTATSLNNIGAVYNSLGQKQKALDAYKKALELFRLTKDQAGEADALNNIGAVYSDLSNNQEALELYNQSLIISQDLKDQRREAATLHNIGRIYEQWGDKTKALNYFTDALSIRRLIGDKEGVASTLTSIGSVYHSLGEYLQALDYYNQALPLRQEVGDQKGEATTLNDIGGVFDNLDQDRKAIEYYNKALKLYEKIEDRDGQALVLNNIGGSLGNLGDNQEALIYYNKALSLYSVEDRDDRAMTLNNIGALYVLLNDKEKSSDYLFKALPLSVAVGNRSREAATLRNLMSLYRLLGNPRLAIWFGKQSVDVYQRLRSNIRVLDSTHQKTYLKSVETAFRDLAALLITQGRLSEAQQVLNTFKDQDFFDLSPSPPKQLSLDLTSREQVALRHFDLLSRTIGSLDHQVMEFKSKFSDRHPNEEDTKELSQIEAKLRDASEVFSDYLKQVEAEFSKFSDDKDKVDKASDTSEMQATLRELQSQTGQKVAAIYTLEDEKYHCSLIITPDKIVSFSYPIDIKDLKRKELDYFDHLSKFNEQTKLPQFSQSETKTAGKELYKIIFAPIDKKLKEINVKPDVLMWSLDRTLRYLPVGALYDGRRFLAERYRNVVFTRANPERMLAQVSPKWTGSGFYNSKDYAVSVNGQMKRFAGLANAKTEVENIFGVPPVLGNVNGIFLANEQFTRTALFENLRRHSPLVHIASHFWLELGDANSSFLLLGDGNKMTLEDFKNAPDDLFSGVELLTLSACETSVEKERKSDGREIDSFAELTQRKGAKAVLASLWKVDDESTSQLMTRFYQVRETKQLTKAEALQKAQRDLLKDNKFSHPYYWAPFILIGNWR